MTRPFVIVTMFAAVTTAVSGVTATEPSLDEIARALQGWKSSWRTLRLRYERRNPAQLWKDSSDPKIKNAESLDDYFFRKECFLDDKGPGYYLSEKFRAGVLTESSFRSVDPSKSVSFSAEYRHDPNGSKQLVELKINKRQDHAETRRESRFGFLGARTIDPLYAIRNIHLNLWIGDDLQQGQWRLAGFEEVDGARSARVELRQYYGWLDPVYGVRQSESPPPEDVEYAKGGGNSIWLDPAHGWLPCRYQPSADGSGEQWKVTEFQQCDNGLWFPKRGARWHASLPDETTHWVVLDVAFDEPAAPQRFVLPSPEADTAVIDSTGQFTRRDTVQHDPSEREPADPGADGGSGLLTVVTIVLLGLLVASRLISS